MLNLLDWSYLLAEEQNERWPRHRGRWRLTAVLWSPSHCVCWRGRWSALLLHSNKQNPVAEQTDLAELFNYFYHQLKVQLKRCHVVTTWPDSEVNTWFHMQAVLAAGEIFPAICLPVWNVSSDLHAHARVSAEIRSTLFSACSSSRSQDTNITWSQQNFVSIVPQVVKNDAVSLQTGSGL